MITDAGACTFRLNTLSSKAQKVELMSTAPETVEVTSEHVLVKAPARTCSSDLSSSANLDPPAAAWPPQSAAYPAIPPVMPSVAARDASSQSSGSATVAAPPCESGHEKQVATGNESFPQSTSSDDTVIAGRKGSASGTIALPSDQTTVPWPTVPGAPPGYPGDWHSSDADTASTVVRDTLRSLHALIANCALYFLCCTNKHLAYLLLVTRHTPYIGRSCPTPFVQRLHGQAGSKSGQPCVWQQWQQQPTTAVPAGLWTTPARVRSTALWTTAVWGTTAVCGTTAVWGTAAVWQSIHAGRQLCTSTTVPAAPVSYTVQ